MSTADVGRSRSGTGTRPRRDDVRVRLATADDQDAVGGITLAAYDGLPWPLSDTYRERLGDASARIADDRVLVAEVDGRVVGAVAVALASDDLFEHDVANGDGGFRMLAVHPAAQGQGVGRALTTASLGWLRAHGARRVLITTMEQMTTAQAMYADVGFVRRADLDVRYPGGRGLVLALDLVEVEHGAFAPAGPELDVVPWYEDAPHRNRRAGAAANSCG